MQSLPLLKKRTRRDKISQQVVLKKQTVELEKSSCCLIPETQKEIKITFN
jgi:hypothetical protein